jgi:hypothetical protein
MEHDSDCTGHLPSHIPLMSLFGSPVQTILCPTSLVFARPAQKPGSMCQGSLVRMGFAIGPRLVVGYLL